MGKAERLRLARKNKYGTIRDAATALGVKYSTYVSHENGTRDFDERDAEHYARRFKVSVEWLVFGREALGGIDDQLRLLPVDDAKRLTAAFQTSIDLIKAR